MTNPGINAILKMPKTKCDSAEEPTIYNFYKILKNMVFKVQIEWSQPQYFMSTVDRNTPWRQLSSRTGMVQQQSHMQSGKNKLERSENTIIFVVLLFRPRNKEMAEISHHIYTTRNNILIVHTKMITMGFRSLQTVIPNIYN